MPAGIGTAHDAQSLKVLIVTDAWAPQVNGVVRTLEMLGRDLRTLGHEVRYATPEGRFTVPMPTYPEIRLSVLPRKSLEREIEHPRQHVVHRVGEGEHARQAGEKAEHAMDVRLLLGLHDGRRARARRSRFAPRLTGLPGALREAIGGGEIGQRIIRFVVYVANR